MAHHELGAFANRDSKGGDILGPFFTKLLQDECQRGETILTFAPISRILLQLRRGRHDMYWCKDVLV